MNWLLAYITIGAVVVAFALTMDDSRDLWGMLFVMAVWPLIAVVVVIAACFIMAESTWDWTKHQLTQRQADRQ